MDENGHNSRIDNAIMSLSEPFSAYGLQANRVILELSGARPSVLDWMSIWIY